MPTLYTIGHSTHTIKEFKAILQAHTITHLIDIRSIPKSRHVPWFNENKLKSALKAINITYIHMIELGGLRHTTKNSINQGWRNKSFRGYADYMQTAEFFSALKTLNKLLNKKRKVAIMCAEAVPWRCHRSLVADAEVIRGVNVLHILNAKSTRTHSLTSFAVIDRSRKPMKIYYPNC